MSPKRRDNMVPRASVLRTVVKYSMYVNAEHVVLTANSMNQNALNPYSSCLLSNVVFPCCVIGQMFPSDFKENQGRTIVVITNNLTSHSTCILSCRDAIHPVALHAGLPISSGTCSCSGATGLLSLYEITAFHWFSVVVCECKLFV